MNALPQALDLPLVRYEQLRGKLQTFVASWQEKSKRSACLSNGSWGGIVDNALRDLLTRIGVFVSWVDAEIPTRTAEATLVLEKLSPTDRPLPSALMTMRTNDWSELLKYFNNCTHHNSVPDPVEFRQNVERLEIFLLEHLEPRTFEDQAEIESLIAEVEADDDR